MPGQAKKRAAGGASASRLRPRIAFVIMLVLLLAGAGFVVNQKFGASTAGDDSTAEPADADSDPASSNATDAETTADPDPLTVDEPQSGPIEDIDAEQARVEESVGLVVTATNEIAERGDGAVEGLEAIATGFVLGELQNLSREQAEQGYTQSGEAQIVSTELLESDLDADPPHILLGVCIDVSSITLTDANGDDVSDLLYNPGHPVRHEYGADFIDEVWKISTHEIPSDQNCPSPEEA